MLAGHGRRCYARPGGRFSEDVPDIRLLLAVTSEREPVPEAASRPPAVRLPRQLDDIRRRDDVDSLQAQRRRAASDEAGMSVVRLRADPAADDALRDAGRTSASKTRIRGVARARAAEKCGQSARLTAARINRRQRELFCS